MRTTVFKTGGTVGPELKKGEKKYVSAVATFLRVPVIGKDGKQETVCAKKWTHEFPREVFERRKTPSSIGSVSLPVKVFCWLG